MDFTFSEEIQSMADMLRTYATKELKPKYQHWDKTGETPYEIWEQLGEMGLYGMLLDEEWGGTNMGFLAFGVAAYELARGDFNAAYPLFINGGMARLLQDGAPDEIKNEWIPKILAGEKRVCFCLTEPGCGTDAGGLTTRAVRDGDEWVLTGEKASSSFIMEADAMLVFARSSDKPGSAGVSLFFVPCDAPGVSRSPYDDMGSIAVKRGSAILDEVRIPAHHMLGEEGKGFHQAMELFDGIRVLLGIMCLAAAEVSLEETIEYVKQRKSFGKPIGKNQGVQFPIAEAHCRVESAKWFCFRTLWLRDQGLPHTKEASICKVLGQKDGIDAIYTCLQLHGHYGYTKDFPFEQRLRDTMGIEFADGTSQVQKIVISRELMGREMLSY